MNHYIYDGTFEGLLTVFSIVFLHNIMIETISDQDSFQPNLFTEAVAITTDSMIAARFFKQLAAKFTKPILTDIGYCFLSEQKGIEKELLDYIRMLLTYGEKISRQFSNPIVMGIRQTSDRVGHEIHRMHGFIRFRKLKSQIYYAPIEPDYNIVQFLAPHFKARFADQQWIIHDVKRQSGLFYNGRTCTFLSRLEMNPGISGACQANMFSPSSQTFDPEEGDYQTLWGEYFQKIAIVERENRKVQRQRMPARYWRHLVERVET